MVRPSFHHYHHVNRVEKSASRKTIFFSFCEKIEEEKNREIMEFFLITALGAAFYLIYQG